MVFEPDVLEAAHRLRLRVGALGLCKSGAGSSGGGGCAAAPLDVAASFISESELWDHYELISREFYVHHESRDD